jgi:hypothetical protein
MTKTASERLKDLRRRAGYTVRAFSRELGYNSTSAVQYYEDPARYRRDYLPGDMIEKAVDLLVGRGEPPITADEVRSLAANIEARSAQASRYAPVYALQDAGERKKPIGSAELGEKAPGEAYGVTLDNDSLSKSAPAGALLIVDANDTDLISGKRYLIEQHGQILIRRYYANPERWEAESLADHKTLFPHRSVKIFGRIREARITF